MSRPIGLTFLGAARTVTGSKTLVEVDGRSWLVDCGLFQGPREIRSANWLSDARLESVRGIILTHAHIDHSGYLPKMVKDGFRGPIYCSPATAELCRIMLLDAAHLQEEDARFANLTRYSSHDPALPLYTQRDAEEALRLLVPVPYDQWRPLDDGLSFRLLRAGHILGSSFVVLNREGRNGSSHTLFTGDLGNGRSRVLRPPATVSSARFLILEGTYGDRCQPRDPVEPQLAAIVNRVIGRGGTLVIPAFTVGRTQELLFILRELENQGLIPSIPVYVDSPMALDATEIYRRFPDELRWTEEGGEFVPAVSTSRFQAVRSADDSMLLCMSDEPKVVISAAGMLTGGRILHHLKARLPDERNAVLFVGYQVEGTKGQLLKNGLGEIRIHHRDVTVEAEILTIDSLSAHADSDDIMEWLGHFQEPPQTVFLNHGEPQALRALAYRIENSLGWSVRIPEPGERHTLDGGEE